MFTSKKDGKSPVTFSFKIDDDGVKIYYDGIFIGLFRGDGSFTPVYMFDWEKEKLSPKGIKFSGDFIKT